MKEKTAIKDVSSNPIKHSFYVDLQVKMNPRVLHCRYWDLLAVAPRKQLIFIRAFYANASKKHTFSALNGEFNSH